MEPKKYVSDDGRWPKPCPGGCGRVMRAPHHKASQFPGRTTRAAVNNTGMCGNCAGKPRNTRSEKPVETEEARLRRMRADIDALVRSRRARGIPQEGTLMPGEEPERPDRQRQMPQEADGSLGFCKRGHQFTRRASNGNRWCDECHKNKVAAARDRMYSVADKKAGKHIDRSPSPEAPFGRCLLGHAYSGIQGIKEPRAYCATCKKKAARARYYRKANQERHNAAA